MKTLKDFEQIHYNGAIGSYIIPTKVLRDSAIEDIKNLEKLLKLPQIHSCGYAIEKNVIEYIKQKFDIKESDLK